MGGRYQTRGYVSSVHLLLILAVSVSVFLDTRPAYAEDVAYPVTTVSEEWVDAAREDRSVPIKAYLPVGAKSSCPVLIFSHGLGGSRDGYAYLGEHWASHGYVSVHLQHLGSDEAVWKDVPLRDRMRAMKAATKKIDNSLNRPTDVSFAIDTLEKFNDDPKSPFYQKLDLSRIGMAGHSYGAFTTMAIAGQTYILPNSNTYRMRDSRVSAAIAMSSQAPRDPTTYHLNYADISIPIFHMTGTKDTSRINPTSPASDRRIAYDHTPGPADGGPETYLLTFTDGDHMVFSGRSRSKWQRRAGRHDEAFQQHIRHATLAFWEAYLNDDSSSRDWLRGDGFRNELGDDGVYEVKP